MSGPCWLAPRSRAAPVVGGQVLVAEAPSRHPAGYDPRLVDGVELADVVPSRELLRVAFQLLWAHPVVRPVEPALEDRPVGLHPVRGGARLGDPLYRGALDRLVVLQRLVDRVSSVKTFVPGWTVFDQPADLRLASRVRGLRRDRVRVLVLDAYHCGLA